MLLIKGNDKINLSNPIQIDAYKKAGYVEDKKPTKAVDKTEKK